ncbi:hypothetical protein BKA93DRAFT_880130 [Sparassis latifolia]
MMHGWHSIRITTTGAGRYIVAPVLTLLPSLVKGVPVRYSVTCWIDRVLPTIVRKISNESDLGIVAGLVLRIETDGSLRQQPKGYRSPTLYRGFSHSLSSRLEIVVQIVNEMNIRQTIQGNIRPIKTGLSVRTFSNGSVANPECMI